MNLFGLSFIFFKKKLSYGLNYMSNFNYICLLFHITYVNSNWSDALKTSQGKIEVHLREGGSPNPPAKPSDLLNGASSLHGVMRLLTAVQSK